MTHNNCYNYNNNNCNNRSRNEFVGMYFFILFSTSLRIMFQNSSLWLEYSLYIYSDNYKNFTHLPE
jgi:hypothetical protein